MKVVKCYRDSAGDICYLYNGIMYEFFGYEPLEGKAKEIVEDPNHYCGSRLDDLTTLYWPQGLESVFVTQFEFEENQTMNKVKTIGQKVMEEGWRISYIRPDRSVSTGTAVFTVLTRQIPKSESGLKEQYEVRYSICNPKDSFCRREGIETAYGRESMIVESPKELVLVQWSLDLKDSGVKLSRDANLTIALWLFRELMLELDKLNLIHEKENSTIN